MNGCVRYAWGGASYSLKTNLASHRDQECGKDGQNCICRTYKCSKCPDGTVGVGGTLAFTIVNGGSGYINPSIEIPEPVYENMPVRGVSRLGIGATTETGKNLLLNLTVGAAGTSNVGIGSTLFLIDSFKIARNGYAFNVGDIVEVVGLVTAKDYNAPIEPFQLEITQTFNDFFSSWSFGEMDYIDSIKGYQNGSRKRFPLFYNGELLSFEIDPAASTVTLGLDS